MTLPSLELRRSANLDDAISILQTLATNCRNDALPPGVNVLSAQRDSYVRWAMGTEIRLRAILGNMDAAAYFDGPRHRDICSMTPGAQLLPMMNVEMDAQSHRFADLASELEVARGLFKGAGTCVVPDTSFYVEHGEKIEDIDFHALVRVVGSIRILVPMVIVDELDGLKRSGSSHARWRAGYSLAVVDRLIENPPWHGVLHPREANPPRGEVTYQIVFDPRGHVRLPISDDEIVDRGLACQPFTGDVTVITYDTGQSTRARTAGLKVEKLSKHLGEEPST
jgi:hypothetical protein